MTKPVFTPIICAGCGAHMGKKPGVEVVTDAICNDPICVIQGPAGIFDRRDAIIFNRFLDKDSAGKIAEENGMSRQRVYQIVGDMKQGI